MISWQLAAWGNLSLGIERPGKQLARMPAEHVTVVPRRRGDFRDNPEVAMLTWIRPSALKLFPVALRVRSDLLNRFLGAVQLVTANLVIVGPARLANANL